jgi:hypothetical protein
MVVMNGLSQSYPYRNTGSLVRKYNRGVLVNGQAVLFLYMVPYNDGINTQYSRPKHLVISKMTTDAWYTPI